jgi:translation initiation factor 3 subunit G
VGRYPSNVKKWTQLKTKGFHLYSLVGKKRRRSSHKVTNLPENIREADLQELFRSFGPLSTIKLAKDKNTGQSKGVAIINFHRRENASKTIQGVSGFGYDKLDVEWAKPDTQQY